MGVMLAQGVTGTKASAFPLFPSSLEAIVSRCGAAVSLTGQTGQIAATSSPAFSCR
jgi:hypothetical protein